MTHPNYITASPSGSVRVLSTDDLASLPHTAVEQACKAAVATDPIAKARADTTKVAVGAYSSLERTAKNLPAHLQLSLIRAVLPNLSFSYGHDKIADGVELVQIDLDEETRQNDEPQYGWRAS